MGYKLSTKAHTDYGRIRCLFMHTPVEVELWYWETHSLCPWWLSLDQYSQSFFCQWDLMWLLHFIKSDGMFHMPVSISISDHLVRTASRGRTHVRSCHSISSLVSKRIEALFRATTSGEFGRGNAGMFCFFGLLNRCPRLSSNWTR